MSGAARLLCKASVCCLASEAFRGFPSLTPAEAAQQCGAAEEWTDLKLLQLAPRLLNLEPSKQLL